MKPEKLPLQSADGAQINLDMLYQIAPSCFTEARGADGKVRRVVNIDVLLQLLGDAAAESIPADAHEHTTIGLKENSIIKFKLRHISD